MGKPKKPFQGQYKLAPEQKQYRLWERLLLLDDPQYPGMEHFETITNLGFKMKRGGLPKRGYYGSVPSGDPEEVVYFRLHEPHNLVPRNEFQASSIEDLEDKTVGITTTHRIYISPITSDLFDQSHYNWCISLQDLEKIPLEDAGKLLEEYKAQHPPECFIATEVYGDPNHPSVVALRRFRDETLSQYSAGRAFIDFYYSGAGRKTARFIGNRVPQSKPMIRAGLELIVKQLGK